MRIRLKKEMQCIIIIAIPIRKVFPFHSGIIKESAMEIGKLISKGIMKESCGKRGFI